MSLNIRTNLETNGFERGIDTIQKKTSDLGKQLERIDKNLSSTSANIGKSMRSSVSGIASFGAAMYTINRAITPLKDAIKTIVDFEYENSRLASILGTVPSKIKELTESAEDLGRKTMFTASQVTQLQIELAKLGYAKQDILDMEASVLRLSTATGGSLADAAALSGAALRMFGAEAKEAERYTAAMAIATTKSALDFNAIRDNLATFGPVANSFGLSIEDTLALFGMLKNAGYNGSTAMTSLRNIMNQLATDNGKLAQKVGGAVHSLEEMQDALLKLREQGTGASEAIKAVGKRGGAQLTTLIQNAEGLVDLRDRIKAGEAGFEEMAQNMQNNVAGSVKILQSAWEGLILTFRESDGVMKSVVDTMTQGVTKVREFISSDGDLSEDTMRNLIEAFVALAAAVGMYKAAVMGSNTFGHMKYASDVAEIEAKRKALLGLMEVEASETELQVQMAVKKGAITEKEGQYILALRAEVAQLEKKVAAETASVEAEIQRTTIAKANAESEIALIDRKLNLERKRLIAGREASAAEKERALATMEANTQSEYALAKTTLAQKQLATESWKSAQETAAAELVRAQALERTALAQAAAAKAAAGGATGGALYEAAYIAEQDAAAATAMVKSAEQDVQTASTMRLNAAMEENIALQKVQNIENQAGVLSNKEKTAAENIETLTQQRQAQSTALNTAQKKLNTLEDKKNALAATTNAASQAVLTGSINTQSVALKLCKEQWNKMAAAAKAFLLENPLLLAVAAITAVGFALYKMATADDAATAAHKALGKELDNVNSKIDESAGKAQQYIDTIKDETATEYQRIEALRLLKQEMKGFEGYSMKEILDMDGAKLGTLMNQFKDNSYKEALDKQLADVERYQELANKGFTKSTSEWKEQFKLDDMFDFSIWDSASDRLEIIQKYHDGVVEKIKEYNEQLDIIAKRKDKSFMADLQDTADGLDDVLALFGRVQAVRDDMESHPFAFTPEMKKDQIEWDLESIEGDINAKISELENNKLPLTADQQKMKKSLEDLKLEIERSKTNWQSGGLLDVGLFFSTNLDWIQKKLEELKAKWEVTPSSQQNTTEDPDSESYKEARRTAETRYKAAKAEKEAWEAGKRNGSVKDYNTAKDDYKKAKEEAEKYGIDTSKNAGKAEENRRKTLQNQENNYLAQLKKDKEKRKKTIIQYENEIEQARIDALADGAEKILAQRKLDHKKEMEQIKQEAKDRMAELEDSAYNEFKKNPNNKGKKFDLTSFLGSNEDFAADYNKLKKLIEDVESGKGIAANGQQNRDKLKSQFNDYVSEYEKLEELRRTVDADIISLETIINEEKAKGIDMDTQLLDIAQKRLAVAKKTRKAADFDKDMNTFMQEYGDYEMKLNALKEEYENNMLNAEGIGEKASLTKKYEEAVSELNIDRLKDSLGWENIFSDLDEQSEEVLKDIQASLREYLSVKDISAENAKVFTEQLNKVNKALAEKKTAWMGMFSGGIFGAIKQSIDEKNEIKAYEEEIRLTEQLKKKYDNEASSSLSEAKRLLKEKNISYDDKTFADLKSSDFQKLGEQLKSFGGDADKFGEYIGKFISAKGSSQAAGNQITSLTKGMAAKGGGSYAKTIAKLDMIFTGIHDNLESLKTWMKEYKVDQKSDFGKKVITKIESYDNAYKGWESFKKGDVVGVLRHNYEAWNKLFDIAYGSNMQQLEEEIEQLRESNVVLSSVIQDLTDELKNGTFAEAVSRSDRLIELSKEEEKNDQTIILDKLLEWEHGSHSLNATASEDSRLSSVLGAYNNFFNKNASSVYEMFDGVTAAEWKAFREDTNGMKAYTTLLDILRDSERKHNASGVDEMLQDYISQYASATDDITDTIKEKFTSITFDSLYDEWVSTISDMESTADDFSSNVSKMMYNALVNNVMSDNYKEQLQGMYDDFAAELKAGNGTVSEGYVEWWKSEYKRISESAQADRDYIAQVTGYDADTKIQATTKSAATMTEDTAAELNGRFTSMQISNEVISQQMVLAVNILTTMSSALDGSKSMLENINTNINTSNGYLYDIYKNGSETLGKVVAYLDQIQINTKKI